jgi:hypothetical protein
MNDTSVSKSLYQRMSPSTLKVFIFILYPISIAGQVSVVISKTKEGMLNTGTFGLPNVVIQVCCIATIGILTVGMQTFRNELRSRTNKDDI